VSTPLLGKSAVSLRLPVRVEGKVGAQGRKRRGRGPQLCSNTEGAREVWQTWQIQHANRDSSDVNEIAVRIFFFTFVELYLHRMWNWWWWWWWRRSPYYILLCSTYNVLNIFYPLNRFITFICWPFAIQILPTPVELYMLWYTA